MYSMNYSRLIITLRVGRVQMLSRERRHCTQLSFGFRLFTKGLFYIRDVLIGLQHSTHLLNELFLAYFWS